MHRALQSSHCAHREGNSEFPGSSRESSWPLGAALLPVSVCLGVNNFREDRFFLRKVGQGKHLGWVILEELKAKVWHVSLFKYI